MTPKRRPLGARGWTGRTGTDENASRAWTRWAGGIVHRRWLAAAGALILLALLVVAATNLKPGISDVNTLAKTGDAKDGLVVLQRAGIGSGTLLPHELLVSGASPEGVAGAVSRVDGIHGAVAPTGPEWRARGTAVVEAFPVPDGSSAAGRDLSRGPSGGCCSRPRR